MSAASSEVCGQHSSSLRTPPASARLRHGSIQRNGVSALISQGLLQLINALPQFLAPLLQLLLAGVLNLIHLLAATVHHFGVSLSQTSVKASDLWSYCGSKAKH